MKKVLLGVLALSSASSLANAHGYIKSDNTSIGGEKNIKYVDNNIEDLSKSKKDLGTRLDAGVYLTENKDVLGFVGGNLSVGRVEGSSSFGNLNKKYYLGTRIDSNLSQDSKLTITGLYVKNEKEKKAIIGIVDQLKAKGEWNDSWDINDKETRDFLLEHGYRLNEKENDTILISSILNTKALDADVLLGNIYNSSDFSQNRLENFAKLNYNFGENKTEAYLNYVLGKEKDFSDTTIDNNVKYGGHLRGYVKLTNNSLENIELTTKPLFDLETVLERDATSHNRNYKVGIENTAKYGSDNLDATLKLNYLAEVSRYDLSAGEKASETENGVAFGGNFGSVYHNPEVKLNLLYKGDNFVVDSKIEDKVEYGLPVGTAYESLTSDKTVDATSLSNKFKFKNNVNYKFNDNLEARLTANALLNSFENYDTNHKFKNNFNGLLGLGLTSKGVDGDLERLNKFDVRYNLHSFDRESNRLNVHILTAASVNELKYKLNDNINLEGKLNLSDIFLATNVQNDKTNVLLVKPSAKVTYSKDELTLSSELVGRYVLGYVGLPNLSTLGYSGSIKLDSEVKYNVNEDITLGSGLGLRYSNVAVFSDKLFDEAEKEIQQGLYNSKDEFVVKNFEGTQDSIPELRLSKDNLDELEKDINANVRNVQTDIENASKILGAVNAITVTPSVSAVLKYGNLTITPKLETGFVFNQEVKSEGNDKITYEKEALRKITGKATLKVDYAW